MAVIGIRKLIEINGIGYYVVSVETNEIYDFYISINKQKEIINFYESNNCSHPNLAIDYKTIL